MIKWGKYPIGSVCQLINGHAFKPSDWAKTGLPIVRIQNLNNPQKPYNYFDREVNEKHLIKNGDILLSWSGTPGTSFGCFLWNRGRAILNQHIFKVNIDNNKLDDDFFVYAVNSRLDKMIIQAHGGVGLRHITKSKLEAIEIPIPPIIDQRRIVARIKACMERINQISKLRDENIKESGMVFPNKCAYIFNNPNWPKISLSNLLSESISNGIFKRKKDFGSGTLICNVKDLYIDDIVKIEHLERVNASSIEIEKYQLIKGDVLVNRSSLKREGLGRSCMFNGYEEQLLFECHIMRVRLNINKIHPYIFTAFMNSPLGLKQILKKAKTATMTTWNQNDLSSMKIPTPPLKIQKKLVEELLYTKKITQDLLNDEIKIKEKELKLSQIILREAFSGKW